VHFHRVETKPGRFFYAAFIGTPQHEGHFVGSFFYDTNAGSHDIPFE
jgi:hypothetical protein